MGFPVRVFVELTIVPRKTNNNLLVAPLPSSSTSLPVAPSPWTSLLLLPTAIVIANVVVPRCPSRHRHRHCWRQRRVIVVVVVVVDVARCHCCRCCILSCRCPSCRCCCHHCCRCHRCHCCCRPSCHHHHCRLRCPSRRHHQCPCCRCSPLLLLSLSLYPVAHCAVTIVVVVVVVTPLLSLLRQLGNSGGMAAAP